MNLGVHQIEKHYIDEHEGQIFCTKLCVNGKCFNILYDYEKKDEISKFVSTFTEYLPYYVYNADTFESFDSKGDISEELKKISRRCWKGPIVPCRETKVNGIFGEVFLDFYERIVKKSKLAVTYASKRDFKSKSENKGFDNVLFSINDGKIGLVFAEAKFVNSKSSACSSLIKDIKGELACEGKDEVIGHLTQGFMNDYVTFVVEKNALFSDEDKTLLKPFLQELNCVLLNDGNFISFVIEKDIRVECVFFAIFKHESVNPSDYIDAYDAIEAEAKSHLEAIGFKNYNIEVVFIPTKAKSMEIKGEINKYYE